MNKRKVGAAFEQTAAAYLEKQGYRILESNFRCRLGEIDLVAKDGEYLVFVEVKYRANESMGTPFAAVNGKKQATIRRVTQVYLMAHHLPEDLPCRFDVVGITGTEISLIRDAF